MAGSEVEGEGGRQTEKGDKNKLKTTIRKGQAEPKI